MNPHIAKAIALELVAVIAAALVFAYLKRTSPGLRAMLDDRPA
jgi:hypothetical protein